MVDIIPRGLEYLTLFLIADITMFYYNMKTLKFFNHEPDAKLTVINRIYYRFILLLDIFYPVLLLLMLFTQGYFGLYYDNVSSSVVISWAVLNMATYELFRRYLRSQYNVSLKKSIALAYTYQRLHINEIIREQLKKVSP